jgi:hypothetical protein
MQSIDTCALFSSYKSSLSLNSRATPQIVSIAVSLDQFMRAALVRLLPRSLLLRLKLAHPLPLQGFHLLLLHALLPLH